MKLVKAVAVLAVMGLVSVGLVGVVRGAAPAVGEKPKFEMKTVDGKVVSPETLKGRIVIIDFWATWCGPCMQEAGHMVKLNSEYGAKGVAIIGVSLDNDKEAMLRVAKEKGFTWPQVCDGLAWGSAMAKAWEVKGIPRTFILSPEGELVWVGHPAQIDEPLAAAVKKYPTQPPMRARTVELLKEAMKVLAEGGDAEGALAKLADVPEGVQADKGVTEAAQALINKLGTEKGQAALAGNEAAAKVLAGLGAKGSGAVVKAGSSGAVVSAGPVKISEQVLETRLAAAEKERGAGKDVDAYAKYKWVAEKGAGTSAGEAAAKQVASYEGDAAFMVKVAKAKREQEAAGMLWEANGLVKNEKVESAKKVYAKIVAEYGDTAAGVEAGKALGKLK